MCIYNKRVKLSEVNLFEKIADDNLYTIDKALRNSAHELIGTKTTGLIEKVYIAVYQLVYLSDDLPQLNFQDFIRNKVNCDYAFLNNMFSNTLGISIEKYIIIQKIERVKELILYDKRSINDIAYIMHYKSVAHLSNQFKKVTGLTPGFYKKLFTVYHCK
jgi:hypothetical protein